MRSTITSTTGTIKALIEHSLETSARVSNRANRSLRRCAKTPPAPRPSKAIEIARNAKW